MRLRIEALLLVVAACSGPGLSSDATDTRNAPPPVGSAPSAAVGGARVPGEVQPPLATPGDTVPGSLCGPETLTELPVDIAGLVVDGATVYLLGRDGVYSMAIGGGPLTRLATASPDARAGFVSDGQHLYWAAREPLGTSTAGLFTMDKRGGEPRKLYVDSALRSLRLAGPHVYLLAGQSRQVVRIPTNGDPAQDLSDGASAIAVDETHLYWSRDFGEVLRVPLAGGPSELVLRREQTANLLLTDDTYVYAYEDPGLVRVPKTGGALEFVAPVIADETPAIALDGPFLYWSNESGHVFRVPRAGGPVVTVGGALGYDDAVPNVLAFDATAVYFQARIGPVSAARPALLRLCK